VKQRRTKYDDEVIAKIMDTNSLRLPHLPAGGRGTLPQQQNEVILSARESQLQQVHQQMPRVHQRLPQVQQQLPQFHQQLPQVHQQLPQVHQQLPEVHQQLSLVLGPDGDRADPAVFSEDNVDQLLFSELFRLPSPLTPLSSNSTEEEDMDEEAVDNPDPSLISELDFDENLLHGVMFECVESFEAVAVPREDGGAESCLTELDQIVDERITCLSRLQVTLSESPAVDRDSVSPAVGSTSEASLRIKRRRTSSSNKMLPSTKMASNRDSAELSDSETVPTEQASRSLPVLF
jgi:hypothetical protein